MVQVSPNYSDIYDFKQGNWAMEVMPSCRGKSDSPKFTLQANTNTATINSSSKCWALFASNSQKDLGQGTFELSFSWKGGEWAPFDTLNFTPPTLLSTLFFTNQPDQRFQFELQEGEKGSEVVLGFYRSTSTYTISSLKMERLSPFNGILPLAVLGQNRSDVKNPLWTTEGDASVGVSGSVFSGFLKFSGKGYGSAATPIRSNGWYTVSGLSTGSFTVEVLYPSKGSFWSSLVSPDSTSMRFTVKVPMVKDGFFKVESFQKMNFQIHSFDSLVPNLPALPPKCPSSTWTKPWIHYTLFGIIGVLVILLIVFSVHKTKQPLILPRQPPFPNQEASNFQQ